MTEREDTRSMADLAREALAVQDACNLSGVAHGFSRSISRLRALLREEGVEGTDYVNGHPLCLLWSDKIAQLTGTQSSDRDGQIAKAYAYAFRVTAEPEEADIAF